MESCKKQLHQFNFNANAFKSVDAYMQMCAHVHACAFVYACVRVCFGAPWLHLRVGCLFASEIRLIVNWIPSQNQYLFSQTTSNNSILARILSSKTLWLSGFFCPILSSCTSKVLISVAVFVCVLVSVIPDPSVCVCQSVVGLWHCNFYCSLCLSRS